MADAMPYTQNPAPAARPTGVTVIGVLDFIGAGFLFLAALLFLVGGAALAAIFNAVFPTWLQGLIGALAIVLAVLLAAIAVLYLLMGMALMKGKPWAWTVQIVLSALAALNSLLTLLSRNFGAVIGLAIQVLIIWYFFTPPVKAYFGKSHVNTPWDKKPVTPPT
jgi:hypothetical protein